LLPLKLFFKRERYNYDYNLLLKSMGYDIIFQIDDSGYSGDSYVLFKNPENNEYGFLTFGWGSCSRCDALQACKNLQEVEELRNELNDYIIWKESKKEMHDWILSHDWKTHIGRSGTKEKFCRGSLLCLEELED